MRDLGDCCLLARRRGGAACCSPATSTPCPRRATCPAARDDGRVHGLGASDMKGALAVMIELALRRRAAVDCLFFGREELPFGDSALTPLLEREPARAATSRS